jgi:hypothetical protein
MGGEEPGWDAKLAPPEHRTAPLDQPVRSLTHKSEADLSVMLPGTFEQRCGGSRATVRELLRYTEDTSFRSWRNLHPRFQCFKCLLILGCFSHALQQSGVENGVRFFSRSYLKHSEVFSDTIFRPSFTKIDVGLLVQLSLVQACVRI